MRLFICYLTDKRESRPLALFRHHQRKKIFFEHLQNSTAEFAKEANIDMVSIKPLRLAEDSG